MFVSACIVVLSVQSIDVLFVEVARSAVDRCAGSIANGTCGVYMVAERRVQCAAPSVLPAFLPPPRTPTMAGTPPATNEQLTQQVLALGNQVQQLQTEVNRLNTQFGQLGCGGNGNAAEHAVSLLLINIISRHINIAIAESSGRTIL